MEGWVSLYRKFTDWQWYKDINVKTLFIHLLLKANHKDNKWENILIKRGQLITSVGHLSGELKLSPKQIRTALEKLKSSEDVAIKTTNKYSLITVVNYNKYQVYEEEKGKQEDNQEANKGQTKGKQRATNNNDNNNNNYIEEEDKEKILNYMKKAKIFCGNLGLLNSNPIAQQQVILYQNVVRQLYLNKNIDILNNLKVKNLDKIYENMKGKKIDNRINYMIASLIKEYYKENEGDEVSE